MKRRSGKGDDEYREQEWAKMGKRGRVLKREERKNKGRGRKRWKEISG